jgi:carboxymethylenebutenolidase
MSELMSTDMVEIAGHGGDRVEAYLARPWGEGPRGGVVVIHHMPGFDRATKEIVRRFAELGYDASCPNLHYREAPGAAPDDAAAATRARGGVPDERLVGDVEAAVANLRSLPSSNGRVGVIGYCSGGRQSLLVACALDVDAAVDCYGAFVLRSPPPDSPMHVRPLTERLAQLRCPLLGLFGNEDSNPPPAEVDELESTLRRLGKDVEFHRYDGAGHGFFAVDRPSYRVAAANDGWERIAQFFGRHLDTRNE